MLAGFDIKLYCLSLSCLSHVSVFAVSFSSWASRASVGLISLLALISLITPISRWVIGLLLKTNGHPHWHSNGGILLRFLKFILALIIPFSKPGGQGWKEATKWEIFLFLFPLPHLSVNGTLLALNSAFIYFHYPSFLCHFFLPLLFPSPSLFIKPRSIYMQGYTRQR